MTLDRLCTFFCSEPIKLAMIFSVSLSAGGMFFVAFVELCDEEPSSPKINSSWLIDEFFDKQAGDDAF